MFSRRLGDRFFRASDVTHGRIGEIKGFARTVVDRANDAKRKGDKATAERYLEAVNRLGRQLRDSDTVILFQQTGKALAEVKLSE